MRREGGREEGREEERFLERRGKQDMQKEKEEGKHRGGLFQAEVLLLTGALYIPGSSRGGQNTGQSLPDVQHTGGERRHYREPTELERDMDTYADKHKAKICNILPQPPDAAKDISSGSTGKGSLDWSNKIQFLFL